MLDDQGIEGLYRRGLSCFAIAGVDGRSQSTIYKLLRSRGMVFRSRSQANTLVPIELLRRLYNLGLSTSQIGRLLGLHPTTVVKRFRAHAFPLRLSATAAAVGYSEAEFRRFFCNRCFVVMLNGEGE